MNISELNGFCVKLAAGSITAKDGDGKTRGIVRAVRRWKDAPARDQFEFSHVLRSSGLWQAGESGAVYIDGKKLYWIANKNKEDYYNGVHGNPEYWKDSAEKHNALVEQAEAAGVRVLHCYF